MSLLPAGRHRWFLSAALALLLAPSAGAAPPPEPSLRECLAAAEREVGKPKPDPLPACRGMALQVAEDFLQQPLGQGASRIYEAYLLVFRQEGDLPALERLWREIKSPPSRPFGTGDPRVAFQQMLGAPAVGARPEAVAMVRDLILTTRDEGLIHEAAALGAYPLLMEIVRSDLPVTLRARAASYLGYKEVREAVPLLEEVAFGGGPPALVSAALGALDRMKGLNTPERLAFAIEHIEGSMPAAFLFERWWATRPASADPRQDALELLRQARRSGTPWASGALRRYTELATPPLRSSFRVRTPPPPPPPVAGGVLLPRATTPFFPPPPDPGQALRGALEPDREAWFAAALAQYATTGSQDAQAAENALEAAAVAAGLVNPMWVNRPQGPLMGAGTTVQPYLAGATPRAAAQRILAATDRAEPRALALEASWYLWRWVPDAYRQVRMVQYFAWFGGLMLLSVVACLLFARAGYGVVAGGALVAALTALILAAPWLAGTASYATWPPLRLWMAPLRARIALGAGLAAIVAIPLRSRLAAVAGPVGAVVGFWVVDVIEHRLGLTLRLQHFGSEGWELLYDPLQALILAPPLATALLFLGRWVSRRAGGGNAP